MRRLDTLRIVRPEDLTPSADGLRVVGVFNPGVVQCDGVTYLLLRVAEAPTEKRPGWVGLPRSDLRGGFEIDWVREETVEQPDARGVVYPDTGLCRLTNFSHLRLATSRDGKTIDSVSPGAAMTPQADYEIFGIEDPRITKIGDLYYITYVAVSPQGVSTALATTTDFQSFNRLGIIFPPDNKDVVLYPEPFDDRYIALHRPSSSDFCSVPEMWIARSPDLTHWGDHAVVFNSEEVPGAIRLGAGAPPLRVDDGWLEIYHAVRASEGAEYYGSGIIFHEDDPARIKYHSGAPILTPELPFEREGFHKNVVFPTGCVARDDEIYVYYGAADTETAVAILSASETCATIRGTSATR